jgi:hypothetical protein
MVAGSLRNCADSCGISSEKVAEKSSVCRIAGTSAMMRLMSGMKAMSEHAVGFVEDQDLDLAQFERLLADEVEEASGSRDEDLHAPLELLDLRVDIHPAVHDE